MGTLAPGLLHGPVRQTASCSGPPSISTTSGRVENRPRGPGPGPASSRSWLFLQAVGEATADDLRHGGEVVGPLHGLDAEDDGIPSWRAGRPRTTTMLATLRMPCVLEISYPSMRRGRYGQVQRLHRAPAWPSRGAHVLDLPRSGRCLEPARPRRSFRARLHKLQPCRPAGARPGSPPRPRAAAASCSSSSTGSGSACASTLRGIRCSVVVILGQESGSGPLGRRLRRRSASIRKARPPSMRPPHGYASAAPWRPARP